MEKSCKWYVAFLFITVTQVCLAGTFLVTNTNNYGAGSLHEAINQSNANPGADTIRFNIPTTDAGYDIDTGTWTINLSSALPYLIGGGLYIDGSSQPGYAGTPLIAVTTSSPHTVLWSFGIFSPNNKIEAIRFYGFANGILISEPTGTNNTIIKCFVGTNANGNGASPNSNGIVINNEANNNSLIDNLVSGNISSGVVITNSNGTIIYGNKIGCDINGLFAIANENGIIAESSSNNIIGGINVLERNIISGNNQSGVLITGRTSTNNLIQNNFIGTDITGASKISNLYGVTITRAHGNIIGRNNLISGNTDIGVLLTGKYTRNNVIRGNLIGTDISGTQLLDNHKGIIIKSLANSNIIGGNTQEDRNIVSGNLEIGIYIEASDSTLISGNYIGTDISGMHKVAVPYQSPYFAHLDSLVQGNGIEFNATAKHNILGGFEAGKRNIISGHKVYGVVHYGNSSNNHMYNNFIGTDVTSQNPVPNATGICFDCASHNNDVIGNVISGNLSYGLFYVTRGTEGNRFFGNMVGVDSSGTMAVPNDIGIVVSTGVKNNIIGGDLPEERNLFSGNHLSGMMVTNQLTEHNIIKGNYFGTDITGTQAIPNLYGIIVTTFCKQNTFENNLISGNLMSGIIMYENADSNIFVGNRIGLDANNNPLGNGNGGIFIDQGATNNIIGTHDKPNIIAYNNDGGVLVKHTLTRGNRISGNSFFENAGLAIDIYPFGIVNANDPGDWDSGPAGMLNFPVINFANINNTTGNTYLTGTIDCQAPATAKIEVYIAQPDSSQHGQGKQFIGTAYPDARGVWSMTTNVVSLGDTLTAIAIDEHGNTSEFSENFADIHLGIEEVSAKYKNIVIYPNPATDYVSISFDEGLMEIKSVSLINFQGGVVFHDENISETPYIMIIEEIAIQEGSYIMKLVSDEDISISTIIMIQ